MIQIDVLTYDRRGFAGMHAAGFAMFRGALRRRLGIESTLAVYRSLEELQELLCGGRGDMAIVITDWRTSVERLCDAFAAARRKRSGCKLVYFDIFDQTCTPYFGLLPLVDAYLKSKLLSPVERYDDPLEGGYVVTDFYHRTLGWDLAGWNFGSIPDPAQRHKILPGWNFAVSRHCRTLLRLNRLFASRYRNRPIDVHARITPPIRGENAWYERSREFAAHAAEPLQRQWRVTPHERIPQWRYLLELRRAKLVFSPFGWGEVCLRDYQAVCSGCVLLKPDMSHVRTSPDIYQAHVTYVPLRWDLSDLEEVCRRCLQNETAALTIAQTAQDRMRTYFERELFVDDIRQLLARLGLETLDREMTPQPQSAT
jgi:hypothetical protein